MPIALITDFGTKDYFVGAMKGVILAINDNVNIVDISHDVPPQDIQSAGFMLEACYRDFPSGTIFTAVVDPGVGSDRRAILVLTSQYKFVAPDNGLLSFVFESSENFNVFEISNEKLFRRPVSKTFHGRDIFAPCAAHLSLGAAPSEFGEEISDFSAFQRDKPGKLKDGKIRGTIIHRDRFGNLVTNLKPRDLPDHFQLLINGSKVEKVNDHYAQGTDSEPFLIIGSAGYLEIAAFRGSASDLLNARVGDSVLIEERVMR